MRIAAFGDIHSNHFAFEACIDAAERRDMDGVVLLGDYVSDCPCPQKTLSLIKQLEASYPVWKIRGNREEYLLAHRRNPEDGWRYNSQSGSLLYTYENLTKDDLNAFERLPIAMNVSIDGLPPFEICHGSPWQTRYALRADTPESDAVMEAMKTKFLLCAHIHESYVFRKGEKTIVNGGSVGIPGDGTTDVSFVMIEYEHEDWTPQLVRVKYDVRAAVREFRESGFTERANVWARAVEGTLQTGRNYVMECLRLVGDYAKESGTPFDNEFLWEKAAEALNI